MGKTVFLVSALAGIPSPWMRAGRRVLAGIEMRSPSPGSSPWVEIILLLISFCPQLNSLPMHDAASSFTGSRRRLKVPWAPDPCVGWYSKVQTLCSPGIRRKGLTADLSWIPWEYNPWELHYVFCITGGGVGLSGEKWEFPVPRVLSLFCLHFFLGGGQTQ